MPERRLRTLIALFAATLVVIGCGDDASTAPTSTFRPASASAVPTTPAVMGTASVPASTTVAASPSGITSSPTPGSPFEPYVVVAGDTLIGIARSHGITVEQLIELNRWTDGTAHPIFPGDLVGVPVDSSTDAFPVTVSTDGTASAVDYVEVDDHGPPFNGESHAVADPLEDGDYWGGASIDADGDLQFELVQRFTGDACRQHFADEDDPYDFCIGGHSDGPTAVVTPSDGARLVVIDDAHPRCEDNLCRTRMYLVSTGELRRLVAGLAPSAGAPQGFSYAQYPFMVSVRDGAVAAAYQHWLS